MIEEKNIYLGMYATCGRYKVDLYLLSFYNPEGHIKFKIHHARCLNLRHIIV